MNKINPKRAQLSISEYEATRAKAGKKKLLSQFPVPVLLIFAIPFIILLINIVSYLFYIRTISAH